MSFAPVMIAVHLVSPPTKVIPFPQGAGWPYLRLYDIETFRFAWSVRICTGVV